MIYQTRQKVEIVKFDRVSFHYPSGHPVFYNLSYSFFAGMFYFLTGTSGAGKTSLLKLIYRAFKANKGSVSVFGREISSLSPAELPAFRQRMGLVFQDCRLINHLSLVDNVALALKITGNDLPRSRDHAKELLHWVGLGNFLESLPLQLSDGQRQRAAIARAVITRPLLLLADEPTGNLDSHNAYRLMTLFEELNKMGTTLILATHSKNFVKTFSHIELQLYQGQVQARSFSETASSKSFY